MNMYCVSIDSPDFGYFEVNHIEARNEKSAIVKTVKSVNDRLNRWMKQSIPNHEYQELISEEDIAAVELEGRF